MGCCVFWLFCIDSSFLCEKPYDASLDLALCACWLHKTKTIRTLPTSEPPREIIHNCGGGFDRINWLRKWGLSSRGQWHRTVCSTALAESLVKYLLCASNFVVVVDITV